MHWMEQDYWVIRRYISEYLIQLLKRVTQNFRKLFLYYKEHKMEIQIHLNIWSNNTKRNPDIPEWI